MLATVGAARGLVGQEVASVILSSALISILLTPFVYGGAGRVYQAAMGVLLLARLLDQRTTTPISSSGTPPQHTEKGRLA